MRNLSHVTIHLIFSVLHNWKSYFFHIVSPEMSMFYCIVQLQPEMKMKIMDRVIVCNSTSNNILVLEASFIGGGNRSTRRKPPNCHFSCNIIICTYCTCTGSCKSLFFFNNVISFISSPDPKGHVSYCHHLASVVRRTS